MLIGLDFDGVIADAIFLKQKYAKKLYGIELKAEECKRKSATLKGITDEMYNDLGKYIYSTKAGLEAPEIPDAIKYIKELQKEHEIRIVTSRLNDGLVIINEWLEKRGLFLNIVNTNQKPKIKYVENMDFFLDDDVKKLYEIAEKVKFPCLLDMPYNQESIEDSKIARVTWKVFYELVTGKM